MDDAVEDDRMDAAGWWRLAGLAALGGLGPFAVTLLGPAPHPWTAAVVIALALVVVLPVLQLRAWWSRGGRAAVRATRQWVRAGRVPGDVPDAVWRPRVQRFAGELLRRRISAWGAVALAVLWGAVAVSGRPDDWWFAVVWAVVAVAQSAADRGQRAASVRLLATPARTPAQI
ncbi:hypothetical protein [Curtobacterium pusillum]|uniref:hypothetical protein n=1 Tax=Curtobacterium pusillum TaxID=69373 RepID=UPI0011AAB027|nr:hypothetical protein [Curtobacterium pusillum]